MAVTATSNGQQTIKLTEPSPPSFAHVTMFRVFTFTPAHGSGYQDMFVLGKDPSQPYDDSNIWLGIDDDGVTLALDVYIDGVGDTYTLGPALVTGVTYATGYVLSGNSHVVYLWSSDGAYDWTPVITANAAPPSPIRTPWLAIYPGHIINANKIWLAALTPAQLALERASIYPVVTANVYGYWPFLNRFDTEDWSGNGHRFSTNYNPSGLLGAPNYSGLAEKAFIYRQNFSRGDGSIMTPNSDDWSANTWSRTGGDTLGSNNADTVYPEAVRSENIDIVANTGPNGEATLQANENTANADAQISALVLAGFGPLTSPYPSHGWWNANRGKVTVDCLFDADSWDVHSYFPVVVINGSGLYDETLLLATNTANSAAADLQFNLTVTNWANGSIDGTSYYSNVESSRIATEGKFQRFEIQWKCGTVTGDPMTSVASDGWVKVWWTNGSVGPVLIFDISGIDLFFNEGTDQKASGSQQGLSASTIGIVNWARAIWLGFYGMWPTTNLEVHDDHDADVEARDVVWRTDTGDDDNGEAYHAVLKTKPFTPASILHWFGIGAGAVMAKAANAVSLVVRAVRDYGLEPKTVTANLSPQGSETRVVKRLDDLSFSELTTVQIEISDPDTPAGRWEVDEIALKQRAEARS
jgi:hypothetical protein